MYRVVGWKLTRGYVLRNRTTQMLPVAGLLCAFLLFFDRTVKQHYNHDYHATGVTVIIFSLAVIGSTLMLIQERLPKGPNDDEMWLLHSIK